MQEQWLELDQYEAHAYSVWWKTFGLLYLEVDGIFVAYLGSWLGHNSKQGSYAATFHTYLEITM
jgi:hypothetical protein